MRFRSKTHGAPRPSQRSDDGQKPGHAHAILCRSFRAGRMLIFKNPGFRFAPPWAEVYYAFGVFPLRNGKGDARDSLPLSRALRLIVR
jgi:hypothetical protein